ncbi:MAG: tetraacyldisaccharide 4'-kinase [Gammaproteobacteria bacterium]|nr:tetraacyldisaccharide 4'-kinase [Gammaproteobacteria bacterium]
MIESYILQLWYPDSGAKVNFINFIIFILKPLELVYKFIIRARIYLYKKQIFKTYRLSKPVIIIGNITVGGTGKTMVVQALAQLLLNHGYRPGVILRGYGSNNKAPLLINSETTASECGDEGKLIYNNLQCPVVVCKKRILAAEYLVKNNLCDIVIADDGLQHYELGRDIEICIVDNNRGFGNNKLLPLGPLREEKDRLNRVDYCLYKGSQDKNGFSILGGNILDEIFNLDNKKIDLALDFFKNKVVYLLSGIGNNNSFIDLVLGSELINSGAVCRDRVVIKTYPDHYGYRLSDLDFSEDDSDSIIITTEKDAVKLKELTKLAEFKNKNVYYIKTSAQLPDEFCNSLIHKINNLLKEKNKIYVR